MNIWATFPFLRYVFCLMAGIVAGKATAVSGDIAWVIVIIIAAFYALMYFFGKKLRGFAAWQGALACVLLFFVGFARVVEQRERLMPGILSEDTTYWLVKTETDAVMTPKTAKVQVRILAYKEKAEDKWAETGGKAILYIGKKGMDQPPEEESILVVKGRINRVPPPLNPGVFNYKRYLEMQGVCCQAFISANHFHEVGRFSKGFPLGMANQIRNWALNQVEKYVQGTHESAVISALVLGYREALEEELVQAYATAGTMHVLAVSGLHVGFLYLFLKIIFRPWRRNRHLKWLSFFMTLVVLWGYAFVTGLSPSVMRAVVMFSLVDATLLQKRRTSIYNSLAFAAFALLVWDPYLLWAVGFQLSFLAVLGIVYLQPRLARWYKGKNKAIRWVWELAAVSLAAQFATFALSLYYFGQFPAYFLFTNLIVVPAAFLMLSGGFLVLLLSLLSETLATFAGTGLLYLVKGVNQIIFSAESLPYSRLTTHITELQVWILLLGLLLLLIFFHYRTFYSSVGVFLVFSFLVSTFLFQSYQQKEQKKVVVYHIPGYSLVHFVEGGKEFFMGETDLPHSQVLYQVQPNRSVLGILPAAQGIALKSSFQPALSQRNGYSLLVWRELKLVKVEEALPLPCIQENPLQVDYILLTHNAVKDLDILSCYFTGGRILIDGSNQPFVQKKLKEQAEQLNLPSYLTAETGAFEVKL